jgi:hypothetical protein
MSTEGRDAFHSTIEELKEKGYLRITPIKQDDGTFRGYTWEIFEEPNSGLTEVLKTRSSVFPESGNPVLQIPRRTKNKKEVKQEGITTNKDTQAKEIHEYWQKAMDYPGLSLTPSRKGHINARLSEGFTVEELKKAIDFVKNDPFWRGKNDRNTPFDDIQHIFRNRERVERFLKQASKKTDNNRMVITDEDRAKVKGTWFKDDNSKSS